MYIYSSSTHPSSSTMFIYLLATGLQQMSPPRICSNERSVLLQLQCVLLYALPSAVQLQLTISRSAWGATGVVETDGVMVDLSVIQPKLTIFWASSHISCWSAAFNSSIWRCAQSTWSCMFASVGGSFFSGRGFLRPQLKCRCTCHSLLYISSVHRGLRRKYMQFPGGNRGPTWLRPSMFFSRSFSADCFPFTKEYDTVSQPDRHWEISWLNFLGPTAEQFCPRHCDSTFQSEFWRQFASSMPSTVRERENTCTSVSLLRIRMV